MASKLKDGSISSCGCYSRLRASQLMYTHGDAALLASEYTAWQMMLQRCTNENAGNYYNYGGRGITVCEEWRNSYETFLRDMGRKPGSEYSLDRLDPDGDYTPGNCRWATPTEQARNKRRSRRYTLNGVTKHICEWAEILRTSPTTIANRIKWGWSLEQALTTPVKRKSLKRKKESK